MWCDKEKRNSLFERIIAAGEDPGAFTRELRADLGESFVITHRASGAVFWVNPYGTSYSFRYRIGDGIERGMDSQVWAGVLAAFSKWLVGVRRDLETPDLWEEYEKGELVEGELVTENTAFSDEEKAEIVGRLKELKEQVLQEHELGDRELQLLDEKLAYLEDAVDRMGRLDWRSAALGTLFSMVTDAVVPPHALHSLLALLLQPLGHLLGHPLPGLPPAA